MQTHPLVPNHPRERRAPWLGRLAVLVAPVLLALGVSACGSDDDDRTPTTPVGSFIGDGTNPGATLVDDNNGNGGVDDGGGTGDTTG